MSYRKIYIIGAPGSGKSYTARKLASLLSIETYDLDLVFWNQSQYSYVRADDTSRAERLNNILKKDSWIIEGAYYKWLDEAFRDADVIIILNVSVMKRQWRILKRFLLRKFILGDFHKEKMASFLELWNWNRHFDSDNMIRIQQFIAKYESKTVCCYSYSEIESVLKIQSI